MSTGPAGSQVWASEDPSTAAVVYRDGGRWAATVLPGARSGDLGALLAAMRAQPSEGPVIGLVDAAHEFFVAARLAGRDERLLLSDVTAAVAWDLARDVVGRLGLDVPGDDDLAEVWPAGDLSIFHDLGLDEMELGSVLADVDAYADEMLAVIAERLGFGDAYERALDTSPR